jgi:hypothetical protein
MRYAIYHNITSHIRYNYLIVRQIFQPVYPLRSKLKMLPCLLQIYVFNSNCVSVYFSFLILVCEAIGTAVTPGLLCQPRVIVKMIVEKQVECRLVEETEVLGENLPQRHFCPSQNPT